jgi:hypothetical protein
MKLKTLILSFILSLLVASSALAVTFTPQVAIPSPDDTGSFNKAYTFKNNGTIEPIGLLIKDIMKYLIGICGILGTIMLMYGGFLYIISGGQGKLITDAQNHIVSAIVGIVLAATSYLILATVNPDLVNLKATKINTIQASGCCISDSTCSATKEKTDCKNSSDFIKGGTCTENKCSDPNTADTSGICYIPAAGCGTANSEAACKKTATAEWLGNSMQSIIDKCGLDSTNCALATTKPLTACQLPGGGMGFCVSNACSDKNGSLGDPCGGIEYSGTCKTANKTLAIARSFNPFGYFFNSAVGSPCPLGENWVNGGRSCEGINLGCCK